MTSMPLSPPTTIETLMQRANALAGLSIQELAEKFSQTVPKNLHHHKGWVGELLELALGANAACKPEPDFSHLGIELKTLPINAKLRPLESTFVSRIALLKIHQERWLTSSVWKKLACVLWVPILTETNTPIAERRITTPLLWRPNEKQAAILKQDWQELVELISLGKLDTISAHFGTALQIRPKAPHAKALCDAINADGERYQTLPRGFYLRANFTEALLKTHFISQS